MKTQSFQIITADASAVFLFRIHKCVKFASFIPPQLADGISVKFCGTFGYQWRSGWGSLQYSLGLKPIFRSVIDLSRVSLHIEPTFVGEKDDSPIPDI